MKKANYILTVIFCAVTILPVYAQGHHTPTPNDTLHSIRNLGNGKIQLSIYAPNAKKVAVSGDIVPWGQKQSCVKAHNGVWSTTLSLITDGAYRYNFIVDGVKVQDPKSPEAGETSAIAYIQTTGNEFFTIKNVPHGAIAERHYYSKSLKQNRRMHIWTPAGYEKSTDKLPVLYLIHGGGDNDRSWPTVGCAGFIMDNLMAEGRIKPMIVVMPNGTIPTNNIIDEVPLFTKDLMNDIIPFIEQNYRVLTDKNHRALAGLSMGGMETLDAGLTYYQQFGYLYVLSSGWFANDTKMYAEKGAYLKKIGSDFNKTVKLLSFTQGGPEDIAYNNCKAMLKLFDAAKIKYIYRESPGGHTWYTWRNDLYSLAQSVFK